MGSWGGGGRKGGEWWVPSKLDLILLECYYYFKNKLWPVSIKEHFCTTCFSPSCPGVLLMISEPPGSMLARLHTLEFSTRCAQSGLTATAVTDLVPAHMASSLFRI